MAGLCVGPPAAAGSAGGAAAAALCVGCCCCCTEGAVAGAAGAAAEGSAKGSLDPARLALLGGRTISAKGSTAAAAAGGAGRPAAPDWASSAGSEAELLDWNTSQPVLGSCPLAPAGSAKGSQAADTTVPWAAPEAAGPGAGAGSSRLSRSMDGGAGGGATAAAGLGALTLLAWPEEGRAAEAAPAGAAGAGAVAAAGAALLVASTNRAMNCGEMERQRTAVTAFMRLQVKAVHAALRYDTAWHRQ